MGSALGDVDVPGGGLGGGSSGVSGGGHIGEVGGVSMGAVCERVKESLGLTALQDRLFTWHESNMEFSQSGAIDDVSLSYVLFCAARCCSVLLCSPVYTHSFTHIYTPLGIIFCLPRPPLSPLPHNPHVHKRFKSTMPLLI